MKRQVFLAGYLDATLRAAGQVIFMNSPLSGLLVFAAMFWAAWFGGATFAAAIGSVVGTLVATATALVLQTDRQSLHQGLYGFNGMLVGVALPSFLETSALLWVLLVLAAVASTIATLAINRALRPWSLSGLTFPFVLTSWLIFLLVGSLADILPIRAVPAPIYTGQMATMADFIHALLTSVSQVFLVNNPGSGVLFLLALLVHSRWAAGLATLGAMLAVTFAWALGADETMIYNGIWGYSAVLTTPAVGYIFLKPSRRAFAGSVGAALGATWMQAFVLEVSEIAGLPALTFAFVLSTWGFLLIHQALQPKVSGETG